MIGLDDRGGHAGWRRGDSGRNHLRGKARAGGKSKIAKAYAPTIREAADASAGARFARACFYMRCCSWMSEGGTTRAVEAAGFGNTPRRAIRTARAAGNVTGATAGGMASGAKSSVRSAAAPMTRAAAMLRDSRHSGQREYTKTRQLTQ